MVDNGLGSLHVEQKWGFGMAPIKPNVAAQRQDAVTAVLEILQTDGQLTSQRHMDDISIVKGLYNRAYKQDQWDWFTVWQQLNRPGRRRCRDAANGLAALRTSIKDGDETGIHQHILLLRNLGSQAQLKYYPAGRPKESAEHGYIYIMSTREQPKLLKIGYTERSVEERAREINRATGVVFPYGVRGLWVVADAPATEAALHKILHEYRVRKDREFFHLDFYQAYRHINDFVRASCREA